ncbi:single-stranded DNA-binding protein [Labrys wisconsinensis]|uniref:Single-stranded DNA-binding protein n=1 Tax=Labrys wisconsinensis TaxID=425677 RepID=A0ABU0JES0_9HYPH|nr:single-stranded DNA-binding protein [Labrys wisconsinensis]MDQ0472777.1 single-strand DNA-binding protein [Labrys wisconsinensis]
MSGTVNKVIIIGHLGKDPEVTNTSAGSKIVRFSIATSETWRDKASGERKERTEWHNVVIFNEGLADVAERYLKKGSKAYVEGQLATRKWQAQDGTDRYSTEIVLKTFRGELTLLDRAERQAPSEESYGTTRSSAPASTSAKPSPVQPAFDDDIPF